MSNGNPLHSICKQREELIYEPSRPLTIDDPYMRENSAKKHRVLWPHHVGQDTPASCPTASATTVINAILSLRGLASVTQQNIMDTDPTGVWQHATISKASPGIELCHLAFLMKQALATWGVRSVAIEVRHMLDLSDASKELLERDLLRNERMSCNDFLIANFQQASLVFDGASDGHMSVVSAYDAQRREALVLDPDCDWFRPYWASLDNLQKAMHTPDAESRVPRGYLIIHLSDPGLRAV